MFGRRLGIARDIVTFIVDGPRAWPQQLVGPIGDKNQVADLRGNGSVVVGRCGVTADNNELDRAEVRARRADTRTRAYTLFVNAHDEVRRVVAFLRWHEDDLEQIFPPFNLRGRRDAKPKSGAPADAVATATPAPTTGTQSAIKPAATSRRGRASVPGWRAASPR